MEQLALRDRITRYYDDVTYFYQRYGTSVRGWNLGLWVDGVRTRSESFLASNRRLVRGLSLGPHSRVLDMGCGMGGFSVWAAATLGCDVTGVSLNRRHLTAATAYAHRDGVSDRCRFAVMDMGMVSYQAACADLVVNQETFCHVLEKPRYLEEVYRILKPGGAWRAVESAVQEAPMQPEESQLYRTVCEGFHIPAFWPPSQVAAALRSAGFVEVEVEDVTELIQPTARYMIRHSAPALWLRRCHLDWLVFSRQPKRRANHQGHFIAGTAYGRGFLRGCLRHVVYSARKPA